MLNLSLLIIYIVICIILRAVLQYAKFGRSGLSLIKNPTDFAVFSIFIAAYIINAIMYNEKIVCPIINLKLGIICYAVGIAITIIAQIDMGRALQMGIDQKYKPGLVKTGFFAITRNPIYLALFMILIGYVLLTPTLTSLVLLISSIICIRMHVLVEEMFLTQMYGDEYIEYQTRVPRW